MAQSASSIQWSQSYKEHTHQTGFLDLPRELRDYVYRFAFRVPGAIFIYSPKYYTSVKPKVKAMNYRHKNEGPSEPQYLGNAINVSLLRACRQLHAECSPVLYGENVYRIWFLSNTDELSQTYSQLVRHVLYSMSADSRIYKPNLEEVRWGWSRYFWPSVLDAGRRMLDRFPSLETLTIPLSPPKYGEDWTPAFFVVKHKTREQRIEIAARWLQLRCPISDDRLRACLHLELAPAVGISIQDYNHSRFVAEEDDGPDWDPKEFAVAFEMMKGLR